MSTIQYLSQQAQLAEAAYADFANKNITKYSALLENDMSPTQAESLLNAWDILDHVQSSQLKPKTIANPPNR
jgi:hypothetical protein